MTTRRNEFALLVCIALLSLTGCIFNAGEKVKCQYRPQALTQAATDQPTRIGVPGSADVGPAKVILATDQIRLIFRGVPFDNNEFNGYTFEVSDEGRFMPDLIASSPTGLDISAVHSWTHDNTIYVNLHGVTPRPGDVDEIVLKKNPVQR